MNRAQHADGSRPRLAVIFSRFPVWNQIFAVNDFVELERAGFEIEIFTLRREQEAIRQPENDRFRNRVHYAFLLSPALLWENLKAWCRPRTWRLFGAIVAGTRDRRMEFLKTLFLFPQAVYFARVMQQRGIRHIHAAWASYPATAAWIVSEITSIPFSFSSHAYDIYMVRSLLREKIERSRFVVTCAETNRQALVDIAGRSADGKIFVHRHGTDLERFRPSLAAAVRHEPGWRLLACGFLANYKGFAFLIEACALLRDQGRQFECVIIGRGPQEKYLLNRIRETRLTGLVRIIPPMPQTELARYYHRADVFIHPSVVTRTGNRDVIPNVLVEAMASGTPVISTRLSGIQELIENGRNGILVPSADPQALAEAITCLMKDPVKRARLAQAAQRTVAQAYDRRKNAEGLIRTFMAHVAS
ncbi:MAG TPA: glycosyltransferase [Candidatus Eisenbacteria bacterium]|nr:glycosyltransferase [Candidatus Eisenbacteria bacterium]